MDITADAAATGATTLAARAVGNQRKVSQHAEEKQQANVPPPQSFSGSGPGAEVNMLESIKYLQSMEKRLKASNEVNYKKLNESLLEKIVDLSKTIKSFNGRITFLEEQCKSYKNQQANSKNFVAVDRSGAVQAMQSTATTMRILPVIFRNGMVNPQTTRVYLAPMKA
jgi:hypothetical protein